MPSKVCKLASGVMFWCSMVLIGLLAIPAGILLGAIWLVEMAADAVMKRLSG